MSVDCKVCGWGFSTESELSEHNAQIKRHTKSLESRHRDLVAAAEALIKCPIYRLNISHLEAIEKALSQEKQ